MLFNAEIITAIIAFGSLFIGYVQGGIWNKHNLQSVWKRNQYWWPATKTEHRRTHWWYLGLYMPKYIERFPFSSTFLIFVTEPKGRVILLQNKMFDLIIASVLANNFGGAILLVTAMSALRWIGWSVNK